ncbi:MAG: vitamin K epoxide reductase family protein [Candidatus Micrarchaeia archaeon]
MRVSKRVFFLLVIMSFIGLASALTVLYEFQVLGNLPPFCTLGGHASFLGTQINCAIVLESSYSTISVGSLHVSLEMLAAIWFIINICLVCAISFGSAKHARRLLDVLFGWRFFGLVIVPYLIYLEFFVVHSICIYCTVMHCCIIIDFIIVSYFLFSSKTKQYLNLE